MSNKKPYSERSDLQKIRSQWKKASGLLEREEWTGAIVRAATGAELAANHLIRNELQEQQRLSDEHLNGLLKWANDMDRKLRNLLLPLSRENGNEAQINPVKKKVQAINSEGNSIVHQRLLKKQSTARYKVA